MAWIEKWVSFVGGETRAILYVAFACLALLLLGVVGRLIYTLSLLVCITKRGIRARKRAKKERARRLQYTLPTKENTFVRARLHTVLQEPCKEETLLPAERIDVRLHYAQKLLAEIKSAALSPVERLDVEEISRLIALYAERDKWSPTDIKAVNGLFMQLLKLSAKYEIAV